MACDGGRAWRGSGAGTLVCSQLPACLAAVAWSGVRTSRRVQLAMADAAALLCLQAFLCLAFLGEGLLLVFHLKGAKPATNNSSGGTPPWPRSLPP